MRQTEFSDIRALTAVGLLSAVILGFLFWWIYGKETAQIQASWVGFLPYFNCSFNMATTLLLLFAYRAVKRGNTEGHKKLIFGALGSSALFLISYLIYHHYHGDSKFLGVGALRIVYFGILISHILLSVVQLPLILLTLWFASQKKWDTHKRLAKVTFPIWLYVSVTGVLVFLLLKLAGSALN